MWIVFYYSLELFHISTPDYASGSENSHSLDFLTQLLYTATRIISCHNAHIHSISQFGKWHILIMMLLRNHWGLFWIPPSWELYKVYRQVLALMWFIKQLPRLNLFSLTHYLVATGSWLMLLSVPPHLGDLLQISPTLSPPMWLVFSRVWITHRRCDD